ncbi:hypothetical protein AB3U99_15165 [Niallia sp. JL1B1071]|uniref:hypothetical protein n=1 Tax=Niallia tiangongensis TaxID=3237105 RepID=UPI0037DD0E20
MENKEIEILLSAVNDDNCVETSEKIAKKMDEKNSLDLITFYPNATNIQKITIIQVCLFSNNAKLFDYIESLLDTNEPFFINDIVKHVIEKKTKKQKNIRKIKKQFHNQPDEEKVLSLSYLGNNADSSIIPFLDEITTKNTHVKEQVVVAKLQIISGINGVINVYKEKNKNYCIGSLRQAIYTSLPNNESAQVIIEDLFEKDDQTLIDTITVILYEPYFPTETLNKSIYIRLLEIIRGDYSVRTKEMALRLLKKQLKKFPEIKRELKEIYDSKTYMKKNTFLNRIIYKDIASLLKEIIFLK